MLETVFRLLNRQPSRVAEHLEAYAELASIEAQGLGRRLVQRLCWRLLAAMLCGAAILLAAIAVMLWALMPLAQMSAPWLLPLVPGLFLSLGLACWWGAPQDDLRSNFSGLRQQLAADAAMVRELARVEKEMGL